MRLLALAVLLPALTAVAHGPKSKPPKGGHEPAGSIAGKVLVKDAEGKHGAEAAVVYVDSVDPALWESDERRARLKPEQRMITMKAKRFVPRVLAVVSGEDVSFPNLDPVYHNAFSLSGKNKFDLGLYKDGKSKTQAFKQPGIARVFCNIHPAMTAYVVVLQNPWFVKVGPEGTYKLAGVPPGSYTLSVWSEKGKAAKTVEVRAGASTSQDFEVDASGFKEIPHKNKFSKDYEKSDSY